MWLTLDKKGNSNTKERKQLIEQVLKIIPKSEIEIIVADREFVGEEWMEFLQNHEISFAVKTKMNEQICFADGKKIKLGKYFSGEC